MKLTRLSTSINIPQYINLPAGSTMVSFNNHMTTMDRLPDYAAEMASFKRSDEAREMLLAVCYGTLPVVRLC